MAARNARPTVLCVVFAKVRLSPTRMRPVGGARSCIDARPLDRADKALHVSARRFFNRGDFPLEVGTIKRRRFAADGGADTFGDQNAARSRLYCGGWAPTRRVSGRLRHNVALRELSAAGLDPPEGPQDVRCRMARPSEKSRTVPQPFALRTPKKIRRTR